MFKILSKVQHYTGRIYTAYLTPTETLELSKTSKVSKQDIEWANNSVKAGKSNPRHVYFVPSDAFSVMIKGARK
jgi:hypothetical protein